MRGGDLLECLVSFPAGFSTDFACGKPTQKVSNSKHVPTDAATGGKCELAAKNPDSVHDNSQNFKNGNKSLHSVPS